MSVLRLWVALSRVSPEQVIADGEALYWVGPTRDRKEVRGNRRCWEDLPGFLAGYEIGYCSEDCGRPRNGHRNVITMRVRQLLCKWRSLPHVGQEVQGR